MNVDISYFCINCDSTDTDFKKVIYIEYNKMIIVQGFNSCVGNISGLKIIFHDSSFTKV